MPDFIELRTMPIRMDAADMSNKDKSGNPPEKAKSCRNQTADRTKATSSNDEKTCQPELVTHGPVMRTFSALGIIKNAVERPQPRIEFVTRDLYQRIAKYPWNQGTDRASYYTLRPDDEKDQCPGDRKHCGDGDNPDYQKFNADILSWEENCSKPERPTFCDDPGWPYTIDITTINVEKLTGVTSSDDDVLNLVTLRQNWRLGTLRRYLLIIVDDGPTAPLSAYVSYTDGKKWYYIDKDDDISQRNFDLLTLFLTMMAIPSPATPPVQTINVGG